MKSFRDRFEYLALMGAAAFVNALPYRLAIAAARGLAKVLVRVFRFKRSRTLGRIRGVFPSMSRREALSVAEESLANVFMTAVEMMRSRRLDRAWMDAHVKDGILYRDRLKALVEEGRGVVIMVPHCGNWYMAAWSMACYGLKLFAIAARQRNPEIEAWMNRQYGEVEVLDRDNRSTLAKVIEKLRCGAAFAILPDLRVWKRDVAVPFLGGEANVSRAGAAFAVKCGSPIVVAMMRREGCRHVFDHLATLRPDPAATDRKSEAARLTRAAMKLLDANIQRHPGQWYWYNKRWILEPPVE